MFETIFTVLQTPTTVGLPIGVFVILGLWIVPFVLTSAFGRRYPY